MTQTFLLVGDLHVQLNNLEDTKVIFDEIRKVIQERSVDFVVYLGDVYHTHSVMRQEVVKLVKDNMKTTFGKLQTKPTILVGNHDLVGPTNATSNALSLTLGDVAHIVDKPEHNGKYAFVPFIPNNDEFISEANKLGGEVLFCHQTFDGSRFENGFYAPGGVDQNKLIQPLIISGHIHKEQHLGKVVYIGTPRPLTSAEYNESKGLHIFTFATEDELYSLEKIPLDGKVRTHLRFDITESETSLDEDFGLVDTMNSVTGKHVVSYHIHGKKEFCVFQSDKISSAWKAKLVPAQLKIVMDIKPSAKSKMVIDQGRFSIEDLLKKYVFEVSGMSEEIKDKVWQKISQT